ncbi:hypothetical protein GY45DRAFT_1360965 [Cubamyces sp. BRFM 1775]|nr:hypothetical protein GY45DRAFT_1360965 [Cubamyces sp. BRFM 1775]
MLARNSLSKVCPCAGGRCLAASLSNVRSAFVQDPSSSRGYSTNTSQTEPTAQSIFSPFASTWDNVFEDIKRDVVPQAAPVNPRSFKLMNVAARSGKTVRPQAATASEMQTIDSMFAEIFEKTALQDPSVSGSVGLGRPRRPTTMNNVYSKLRSHSQRLRWTTEADQELDRKKEEMELCETDAQLLDWAMREVFGASQRYERAARPVLQEEAAADAKDAAKDTASSSSQEASTSEESPKEEESPPLQLQPSSYPHLLSALMRTFRDKYKDPHLALSIFDHARHLSIASFVFGCTTPAYNELIETRWRCFRDLRGVVDALEEMRVNGIELDSRTRLLAEAIRSEVGARTIWQEDAAPDSGEVRDLVTRLERLTIVDKPTSRRAGAGADGGRDRERGRDRDRGREDDWDGSGKRDKKKKQRANIEQGWKRKALESGRRQPFRLNSGRTPEVFAAGESPEEKLKNALLRIHA